MAKIVRQDTGEYPIIAVHVQDARQPIGKDNQAHAFGMYADYQTWLAHDDPADICDKIVMDYILDVGAVGAQLEALMAKREEVH